MRKAITAIKSAVVITAAASLLASCEDSPNVGTSLVHDESEVVIASEFEVAGRSVDNPRVQSRTITQVLGRINAKGYGDFSSDFVTQFMPSAQIDTENLSLIHI